MPEVDQKLTLDDKCKIIEHLCQLGQMLDLIDNFRCLIYPTADKLHIEIVPSSLESESSSSDTESSSGEDEDFASEIDSSSEFNYYFAVIKRDEDIGQCFLEKIGIKLEKEHMDSELLHAKVMSLDDFNLGKLVTIHELPKREISIYYCEIGNLELAEIISNAYHFITDNENYATIKRSADKYHGIGFLDSIQELEHAFQAYYPSRQSEHLSKKLKKTLSEKEALESEDPIKEGSKSLFQRISVEQNCQIISAFCQLGAMLDDEAHLLTGLNDDKPKVWCHHDDSANPIYYFALTKTKDQECIFDLLDIKRNENTNDVFDPENSIICHYKIDESELDKIIFETYSLLNDPEYFDSIVERYQIHQKSGFLEAVMKLEEVYQASFPGQPFDRLSDKLRNSLTEESAKQPATPPSVYLTNKERPDKLSPKAS